MYLGHVLAPTLGISKLTWQNSHYRKQNIFVDMYDTFLTFFDRLYHFFDMFWHIFDSFEIFLTDRQTDGQKDRPAYLIWHVLTLFDMFWHFFDSFWHFLTFFWPTDRQTDRQTDIQNLGVEAPSPELKKECNFLISLSLNLSSSSVC